MLKKEPKIVAVFHSTTDACETERLCRDAGVRGRIIPVPTDISADCGLAFMMPPEEKEAFERAICGRVVPMDYYERLLRG